MKFTAAFAHRRGAVIAVATLVLVALAVACYWYGETHQSHIARALTWGILLLCALMHLVGHGRHGHHHGKPTH